MNIKELHHTALASVAERKLVQLIGLIGFLAIIAMVACLEYFLPAV